MFTDDELWDYLSSLDLCVLPYRFGTHSGWLEACVDLGTGVLVPNVGHLRGTAWAPQLSARAADGTVDGADFTAVLRGVLAEPSRGRRDRPDRDRATPRSSPPPTNACVSPGVAPHGAAGHSLIGSSRRNGYWPRPRATPLDDQQVPPPGPAGRQGDTEP